MPISRRKFLLDAGVLTALFTLPVALLAAVSKSAGNRVRPYAALEQSGSWSSDVLVYGVLAVANPAVHLRALQKLRIEHKYRRALRHRHLDRRKLPYGYAVIDYVIGNADFYFAATILKKRVSSSRNRAMEKLTATIRECGGPQVYEENIPKMRNWKSFSADNLRQVADVFTGAVYVDVTRNDHPLRRAFAERLRAKLRVRDLSAPALANGKHFVVIG